MKWLVFALAAALVAGACGGAAQPAPAPTAAASNEVRFVADLKATNEVPPIANDERSGSGSATVVFKLERDGSGALTGAKATFDITLSGFPAGAVITLAHIHEAPAGQNGGVKVGIKTDAANRLTLADGTGKISAADVAVDAATAQAIIDRPGDHYVNVHSALNAGGAVRGQLAKQ